MCASALLAIQSAVAAARSLRPRYSALAAQPPRRHRERTGTHSPEVQRKELGRRPKLRRKQTLVRRRPKLRR